MPETFPPGADFKKAIPVILAHEGGYVKDPADPGGATKYGISLRWLRRQGLDLDMDGQITEGDILLLTPERASELYETYFWHPACCGALTSQVCATKYFDMTVNMGLSRAVTILQTACNALGSRLDVDGKIGQHTIAEANRWPEKDLLHELQVEQAIFYKLIAKRTPTLQKFLPGWLRRAAWPDKVGPIAAYPG